MQYFYKFILEYLLSDCEACIAEGVSELSLNLSIFVNFSPLSAGTDILRLKSEVAGNLEDFLLLKL